MDPTNQPGFNEMSRMGFAQVETVGISYEFNLRSRPGRFGIFLSEDS